MSVRIQEVSSKKDLKRFIQFPNQLYAGNPYYVPAIFDFERSTLDSTKNPAFEYCQARYWLAWKDNRLVGRIAGIIHGNEIKVLPIIRFGWIDFEDDLDISKALITTVADWGKQWGLKEMHGPLGFTDLDFEGTLIEGFDQMATQATIYNYPYYQAHFEKHGFTKACDWVEVRGNVPQKMPRRLERVASIIQSRFGLKVKKFKNAKELLPYGQRIFELLNESYSDLYGYFPLSEQQIQYYIKQYFGFVRKDFVSLVVNDKEDVVAFAITLPSLSKAFQKAKGSLFPFGWIPVLRAFYTGKDVDMFLIAVKPEYQRLGASPLIFHDIFQSYIQHGVRSVASGPMLEGNKNVLNLWNEFQEYGTAMLRRRCYLKTIEQ